LKHDIDRMEQWDSLFDSCGAEAKKCNEGAVAFVVLDSNKQILASRVIGSQDSYINFASMKANAVVEDGNDRALWSPAQHFGNCGGLCYACCGCLCCDFYMLWGAFICTKRLHLWGALPININGKIGALGVSGGNGLDTDKCIVTEGLKSAGYENINGIWVNKNPPPESPSENVLNRQ